MKSFKRFFSKPQISWIVIGIDDDEHLYLQTNIDDKKTLNGHICDGPREFEMELKSNKIKLQWVAGIAPHPYYKEVDATGINPSLFEEPRGRLSDLPKQLIPKDGFCLFNWVPKEGGGYNSERVEINPERLDDAYEYYRILTYLAGYIQHGKRVMDWQRLSSRGTFYIGLQGTQDSKEVVKRFFSLFINRSQWDIIICDKVVVKQVGKSTTIVAKDEDRDWIHTIEDDYSKNEILIRRTEISRGDKGVYRMTSSRFDSEGNLMGKPFVVHGM